MVSTAVAPCRLLPNLPIPYKLYPASVRRGLISLLDARLMKRTKNDDEDDVAREQKFPKFFVFRAFADYHLNFRQ